MRYALSLLLGAFAATCGTAFAAAPTPPAPMVFDGNPGGVRTLEEGQPPAVVHPTVEGMRQWRNSAANRPTDASRHTTKSSELTYHGGTGGVGVETAPKVYLVFWGSQWIGNDPSGEAGTVQSFLTNVGGSNWLNSVVQYCQGVASGTTFCGTSGTAAGNPAGVLAGVWNHTSVVAPSQPTQSQFANEATLAAQYFGNTTSGSNASVQYVIATAHGYNSSGFGTQYCAYHSSTSSAYGNLAYTNLPYITDAGASCGANFNGLGPNAGMTIVGGHELAETITDQFPSTGWLDGSGSENGDKCAWISSGQGASAYETFGTYSFPVQSLWSNAYNSNLGGCVLSYP